MSGQWEYARVIARIESRVTSVERRLRDAIGDAIKFFVDLEDVKARTDEHAPLVAGDVWGLNIDGEWDIITPAGAGISSGSRAVSASGGGAVGPSDPAEDWTITPLWSSVGALLTNGDGVGGAVCSGPYGTWHVSATFVGTSTDLTSCAVFTVGERKWSNGDGPDGPCFERRIEYVGGAVSAVTVTGEVALTGEEDVYIYCDVVADVVVTAHPTSNEVFVACGGGEE